MKGIFKLICAGIVGISLFSFGGLLADKQLLRNDIIRLHVIANSDTQTDQNNKLAVRDAVIAYLQENMEDCKTAEEAKAFLLNSEKCLEDVVNRTLKLLNTTQTGSVSVVEETFDRRDYDTFSLPAGIYNSLKIQIGEAEGKNWWCVVFPDLCIPATRSEFRDISVASGFHQDLTNTLSNPEEYEIRFFLLDCLGKIENFFHFE